MLDFQHISIFFSGGARRLAQRIMYRDKTNPIYASVSAESTFDEVIELDIENNKGYIRKTVEGKYKYPILDLEKGLKQNVLELLRSLIYPEDGEKYVRFWDTDTLKERIVASPTKSITEEFRQKKMDGTWGWVRQCMFLKKDPETNREIIICYIMNIEEEKKDQVEFVSVDEAGRIDKLTGLAYSKEFFTKVDTFLENNSPEGYAMIAVDIEHFKLFNDWYGWDRGDAYLMDIASRLNGVSTVLKGFAGYMGGDNFAVFIKHRPEFIEHMVKEIDDYIDIVGNMAGFLPNLGLYFATAEERVSASAMYDRAVLALNEIKGKFTKRYNIYDASMMMEIDREMSILSEVQKGIENREFIIYMQPQVHAQTNKIVGAETLVRWNSKEKGMISPGVFIPVLEKNGFISNLDKYIWEETCAWQRKRINEGKEILPVSVNVSRVDIFSLDLVQTFIDLTTKYDIPRTSVKIEITESTYAENDEKIGKIAEELRKEGFCVYLDDFGSGYSSLNMLKNIYVDAIKIDMKFLDMDESNTKKGESIIESVISMARSLSIPIIVEGAETDREIQILTAMGCRYVQGFYYYKPMSIDDFENLLERGNVDYSGLQIKRVDQVRASEFFDPALFSDAMINNILGAVAFYEISEDNKVALTRVNEQFYRMMNIDVLSTEVYKSHFDEEEYGMQQELFRQILEEAYANPVTGATYNYVGHTPNGDEMLLHIRVFFLRESEGRRIFYVSFTDVGKNRIGEVK